MPAIMAAAGSPSSVHDPAPGISCAPRRSVARKSPASAPSHDSTVRVVGFHRTRLPDRSAVTIISQRDSRLQSCLHWGVWFVSRPDAFEEVPDVRPRRRFEAARLVPRHLGLHHQRPLLRPERVSLARHIQARLRPVELLELVVVRVVSHRLVAEREGRQVILGVFEARRGGLRNLGARHIRRPPAQVAATGPLGAHEPLDLVEDVRRLPHQQPARVVPVVIPVEESRRIQRALRSRAQPGFQSRSPSRALSAKSGLVVHPHARDQPDISKPAARPRSSSPRRAPWNCAAACRPGRCVCCVEPHRAWRTRRRSRGRAASRRKRLCPPRPHRSSSARASGRAWR